MSVETTGMGRLRFTAHYFWNLIWHGRWADLANAVSEKLHYGTIPPDRWLFPYFAADYLLPRLRAMRACNTKPPRSLVSLDSPDEWHQTLDDIIFAFETVYAAVPLASADGSVDILDELTSERVLRGFALFGKHFIHLHG